MNSSSGIDLINSKVQEKSASGPATFWYVLRGANQSGPFSFYEIVQMLQQKRLSESDLLWQNGMSQWRMIPELGQFSSQNIAELYSSKNLAADHLFVQRRYVRFPYVTSVVFHNNRRLWRGATFELSVGGAGIVLEGVSLCPGQVLFSHFNPSSELEAFNVFCQIVGKQESTELGGECTSVKYSIRFLDVSEDLKCELGLLAEKRTLKSIITSDGSNDAT